MRASTSRTAEDSDDAELEAVLQGQHLEPPHLSTRHLLSTRLSVEITHTPINALLQVATLKDTLAHKICVTYIFYLTYTILSLCTCYLH